MSNSTVYYFSNLQLADRYIATDYKFQGKITDPKALELLYIQTMRLTPEQRSIYNRVSVQCGYAETGDYPWGTEIDSNGNRRLICLCQNQNCSCFNDCRERKPFNMSELNGNLDNRKYTDILEYTDSVISVYENAQQTHHQFNSLRVIIDTENNLEITVEEETDEEYVRPESNDLTLIYTDTETILNIQNGTTIEDLNNAYFVSPDNSQIIQHPKMNDSNASLSNTTSSYNNPSAWDEYWLAR